MTSRRKLLERRRGPAEPQVPELTTAAAATGYQPLITQQAAVADATDAASAITQLNSLLAKLRTIGLIAT